MNRIEGQPAHFQVIFIYRNYKENSINSIIKTHVTPVNDNRLVIQWLKDGQPLRNSNRHSFTNDFGLIAFDIAHTVSNDQGTYSVVAHNEQGEAKVDGELTIQLVDSLLLDTQHETSWQRIQVLLFFVNFTILY